MQSLKHFTLDVVILLEAELKVGLAMETDVIEEALVFPILPSVQNLLICGCELKPSWQLFLMGCYVSYKDNVHSTLHLSETTLYVNFLFGGEGGGRHLRKRKKHFSFSNAARKYLAKIKKGRSWSQ